MRRLRWRTASGLAGMGCLFVSLELGRLLGTTAEPSLLLRGALLLAGVLTCVLLALMAAPTRWWDRLLQSAAGGLASLRSQPAGDHLGCGRVLMCVGVATYALLAARYLSLPVDPSDDDQGAFLATAGEVAQAGGVFGLIRDLFRGEFREANRHPLYIGLLSLRPTVPFGRGLSAVIGLLTLLLTAELLRRRSGALSAGIFCVLLATNHAFCYFTTRVVCESLMVLWGGLIWIVATPRTVGVSNPSEAARGKAAGASETPPLHGSPRTEKWRTDGKSVLRGTGLGLLLGLAYLTKGTGLLLLAGLVIALAGRALVLRPAVPLRRAGILVIVVVAAFTVTASPLLVRNVRRFGTPFYNVNSWLLFVDAYEDPTALADRMTIGGAARQYLRTHGAGDILRRETSGIVWETFILLRSLGPTPLDDGRVLIGLPLALCCAIGLLLRRSKSEEGGDGMEQGGRRRATAGAKGDTGGQALSHRPSSLLDPPLAVLLILVWTGLFVTVLAWYVPVAAGERFVMPLLAPLLMLAAEGVSALVTCAGARRAGGGAGRSFRSLAAWCTVAAVLWCVGWTSAAWLCESLAERLR